MVDRLGAGRDETVIGHQRRHRHPRAVAQQDLAGPLVRDGNPKTDMADGETRQSTSSRRRARSLREVLAQLSAAARPSRSPCAGRRGELVLGEQRRHASRDAGRSGRLDVRARLVVPRAPWSRRRSATSLRSATSRIASAVAAPAKSANRTRSLVIAGRNKSTTRLALVRRARPRRHRRRATDRDCLIEVADELAAAVAAGDGAGRAADRHTAAALCLANRQPASGPSWRRAWRGDATAVAAVAANVLVVDPAGTARSK